MMHFLWDFPVIRYNSFPSLAITIRSDSFIPRVMMMIVPCSPGSSLTVCGRRREKKKTPGEFLSKGPTIFFSSLRWRGELWLVVDHVKHGLQKSDTETRWWERWLTPLMMAIYHTLQAASTQAGRQCQLLVMLPRRPHPRMGPTIM